MNVENQYELLILYRKENFIIGITSEKYKYKYKYNRNRLC